MTTKSQHNKQFAQKKQITDNRCSPEDFKMVINRMMRLHGAMHSGLMNAFCQCSLCSTTRIVVDQNCAQNCLGGSNELWLRFTNSFLKFWSLLLSKMLSTYRIKVDCPYPEPCRFLSTCTLYWTTVVPVQQYYSTQPKKRENGTTTGYVLYPL